MPKKRTAKENASALGAPRQSRKIAGPANSTPDTTDAAPDTTDAAPAPEAAGPEPVVPAPAPEVKTPETASTPPVKAVKKSVARKRLSRRVG